MEWQPIETAPQTGRMLIVSNGNHVTAAWWNGQKERWQSGGGVPVDCWWPRPTHWMPLPTPPR